MYYFIILYYISDISIGKISFDDRNKFLSFDVKENEEKIIPIFIFNLLFDEFTFINKNIINLIPNNNNILYFMIYFQ